jgi:hypothetical protein
MDKYGLAHKSLWANPKFNLNTSSSIPPHFCIFAALLHSLTSEQLHHLHLLFSAALLHDMRGCTTSSYPAAVLSVTGVVILALLL